MTRISAHLVTPEIIESEIAACASTDDELSVRRKRVGRMKGTFARLSSNRRLDITVPDNFQSAITPQTQLGASGVMQLSEVVILPVNDAVKIDRVFALHCEGELLLKQI